MTRSRHALVSAAVILALFITGCAKQPAVTQAAAPPPTGAPVAAAPAPPAAAAPAPAPAAPAPPVVTARPAPKEFAPEPQLPDIYFDFDTSTIRLEAGWQEFVALPRAGIRRALSGHHHLRRTTHGPSDGPDAENDARQPAVRRRAAQGRRLLAGLQLPGGRDDLSPGQPAAP